MPTTQVRDLMSTNLFTLHEQDDFSAADQTMRMRHVRHVPVVRDGALVGIVTHRDLIRAQARIFASALADPDLEHERVVSVKIREIMTRELTTCSPDTPADDAARRMIADKIGCVLVIEGETLVGILTESDLLEWAVEMLAKQRFEQ